MQKLFQKVNTLPPRIKRWLTLVSVSLGFLAVGFYYAWWLEPGHLNSIILVLVLSFITLYNFVQVLLAWFIYLKVKEPPVCAAPSNLKVDVFVPVYDEDFKLVAQSLKAAINITYPHRTFLLDDSEKDEFKELAQRLGAIYLRRNQHNHAKAGNVNHALQFSDADFVTIFDVDHIAEPCFLDKVLGYFNAPEVGFVQALVGYSNYRESFIARATADQSYDIFSPTSMGMYGCGAATVWGAHCTFRRAALDSIGGHQVGLAEDLHTSLALHAAGWKSVYVPQLVARGLVPADLKAYFVQQLKWSRGVFEILFERSFSMLRRLSPAQIICYLTRMTYYLLGPIFLVNTTALILALFLNDYLKQYHIAVASYLVHILPAAFMVMFVRVLVLAMWEHNQEAPLYHFSGALLAMATWPIYILSFICALLRVKVPHLSTPKKSKGGFFLWLVLPQLGVVSLLLAGIIYRFQHGLTEENLVLCAFGLLLIFTQLPVFRGVWEGLNMQHKYRHELIESPSNIDVSSFRIK